MMRNVFAMAAGLALLAACGGEGGDPAAAGTSAVRGVSATEIVIGNQDLLLVAHRPISRLPDIA